MCRHRDHRGSLDFDYSATVARVVAGGIIVTKTARPRWPRRLPNDAIRVGARAGPGAGPRRDAARSPLQALAEWLAFVQAPGTEDLDKGILKVRFSLPPHGNPLCV